MGNCSLKGVSEDTCTNSAIRILTDSGSILEFKAPKLASEVLNDHPGHGIFRQGQGSAPVAENEPLVGGKLYHLRPLKTQALSFSNKRVDAREFEKAKTTEFVENLGNGSDLEVLPSGGDGVWRVKLMIDTKKLEEILSEQGNTEALIERMRMAASLTPKHSKSNRGNWKMSSFSNLFKVPTESRKESSGSTGFSQC